MNIAGVYSDTRLLQEEWAKWKSRDGQYCGILSQCKSLGSGWASALQSEYLTKMGEALLNMVLFGGVNRKALPLCAIKYL